MDAAVDAKYALSPLGSGWRRSLRDFAAQAVDVALGAHGGPEPVRIVESVFLLL